MPIPRPAAITISPIAPTQIAVVITLGTSKRSASRPDSGPATACITDAARKIAPPSSGE